jgi:hypothetical protein
VASEHASLMSAVSTPRYYSLLDRRPLAIRQLGSLGKFTIPRRKRRGQATETKRFTAEVLGSLTSVAACFSSLAPRAAAQAYGSHRLT